GGAADNPSEGRRVEALDGATGGENQRGGAVVERRGIGGGDGPVLLERGREARKFLWAAATRLLVADHDRGVAFALGDGHRRELCLEQPRFLGRPGSAVAFDGELVLGF